MGLSAWLVWAEDGFHENPSAMGFYLGQLGLSLSWDPLFFKMNAVKAGLFVCLAQMATMFNCHRMFGKANRTAGDLVKLCLVWSGLLTLREEVESYDTWRVKVRYAYDTLIDAVPRVCEDDVVKYQLVKSIMRVYAGQGSGHDNQDNYSSQDYSMGHGSAHDLAHGSAPVDDDSLVEEMSPVKAKKPSKRASKAKKNDTKEPQKNGQRRKTSRCTKEYKGSKKFKNSETTLRSAPGGFNLNNEADESGEETQEQRSMGRDQAKKKKLSASPREGSSSFIDLVADKFFNIKSKKWEKMKEQQDSYIYS
nr:translocator protein homolog [Tanacetum cinerariifolium]